ncbi:MAG: NAD(P)/FAD-dependent oxidoreductase [Proteobacteria bacterium]|nr:NAD(P)/FAD-dependent oxidoreductase [Pseudomonadota bacterium]
MGAPREDCIVVGASFAGLACAYALARRGARVTVLERKSDPGEKIHTTGILVKEAVDRLEILDGLPRKLTKRIEGVRLYAPNLRHVDLSAPGYYFLATDTGNVMRWLARRASEAGATLRLGTAFEGARRVDGGFDLGDAGCTAFLVGADGPRSSVARYTGLGRNRAFLFGIEHEFPLASAAGLDAPDRLHCVVDRRLAPGYIGWIVVGVTGLQVGLARRVHEKAINPRETIAALLAKIRPIHDLTHCQPVAVRAGLIPCGGVVHPAAADRALLVGDAAGIVSPVTAGGIHMALKHGLAAGDAIADFLSGNAGDAHVAFTRTYPRFRMKRALRFAFDHFQSDWMFDRMLSTRALRAAASIVYFHRLTAVDVPMRSCATAPQAMTDPRGNGDSGGPEP